MISSRFKKEYYPSLYYWDEVLGCKNVGSIWVHKFFIPKRKFNDGYPLAYVIEDQETRVFFIESIIDLNKGWELFNELDYFINVQYHD